MTYRPHFRKQGDGSHCQWYNCGCASQAMAADRSRGGSDPHNSHGWPPTPPEIRNAITRYCGGTSLQETAHAATHLYGVTMAVRYGVPWNTFRSLVISGRGAIAQIRYSVVPARFDASPGFGGNHAVFVNERRSSDGAYLVYDPLADHRRSGIPQAPQWWPSTVLMNAGFAIPGTATGCINAAFTRDTTA